MFLLDDEGALEAELVGNKAANLASLRRAGFLVPPGLCFGVADVTGLVDGRFRVSSQAEELLETVPSPWAVRSSATAEDGKEFSFAGQYQTVLGVIPERLPAALRRVASSLLSSHAQDYAVRMHGQLPAMAILVQSLVWAEAAGVAFTLHPVTGAAEVVIEASRGLGDLLVGGEIVPDRFTVDRVTGSIAEEQGTQSRQSTLDDEYRSIVIPLDEASRLAPSLSRATVRDISKLAMAVEAHFGTPQDIEWVFDGTDTHVVQARPVTGLPELAV